MLDYLLMDGPLEFLNSSFLMSSDSIYDKVLCIFGLCSTGRDKRNELETISAFSIAISDTVIVFQVSSKQL